MIPACPPISVILTDRKDLQTWDLTVGGSTPAIDLGALGVTPGDTVTVYVDAAGTTETYTVAEVASATRLILNEVTNTFNLVTPDVFTITDKSGNVLYTHTLAGSDTLDLDTITVHDVPIGTPAVSRRDFTDSLEVLPSQVLKVSTAAGNALG